MSQQDAVDRPPSEEELRAAYEQQLKQLRVEDVVVQTVVSLINLGGRKAGLAPGAADEADREQLRLAIEGVRALLPLVETALGPDGPAIRDALSQLQLAFARMPGGSAVADEHPAPDQSTAKESAAEQPKGPGPAQASGRLWVPGQ